MSCYRLISKQSLVGISCYRLISKQTLAMTSCIELTAQDSWLQGWRRWNDWATGQVPAADVWRHTILRSHPDYQPPSGGPPPPPPRAGACLDLAEPLTQSSAQSRHHRHSHLRHASGERGGMFTASNHYILVVVYYAWGHCTMFMIISLCSSPKNKMFLFLISCVHVGIKCASNWLHVCFFSCLWCWLCHSQPAFAF